MTEKFLDRSNYFKGLLLLIGKDSKITDTEKYLLDKVRRTLDFEKKFFEDSVNDFFENEYINHDPPKFSHKEIAEAFLRDGISFAVADNELHNDEYEFLHSVAEVNGIGNDWLMVEIEFALRKKNQPGYDLLEIEKYFREKAVTA